jgi:hypothetical protein
MNKSKPIRCAACEYARQDKKASEYSVKHCGKCAKWENCEVCFGCKKRGDCKARKSQKHKQTCDRRYDIVCGEQTLKWKAIECANPDSEYHKALLNVSPNGDRQERVTWCGCGEGVGR